MKAVISLASLHQRARRLLPAGLATAGVVPPNPACWETSPLSRLALGGGARGGLGLWLDGDVAAQIRVGGVRWLRERAAMGAFAPWRVLPALAHGFWSCRDDGGLGLLVDARDAAVWLLWQVPSRRARCCG